MKRLVEENITGDILQHMPHTEDLILEGPKAIQYVYKTLVDVFNALKGATPSDTRISLKIDGAPNVTAASDYHGRTFVGTKYSFKPKTSILREDRIAYTEDEISKVSDNPIVQEKLKRLLKALPYINIPKDEIWAGDYLFSKEDLRKETIEGENYIVFHPNTIVYAIPEKDPIASMIKRSDFGVAWHTKYTGPDYEHLHVGFDVSMSQINNVPNVFQMDAELPSIAGSVTMTAEETKDVQKALEGIRKGIDSIINEDWYQNLTSNVRYVEWLNRYRNVIIRANSQDITAEGFKEWLSLELDKKISILKKESSKKEAEQKKQEALNLISNENLNKLFYLQDQIRILKDFFVKKLDKIATIKTFLHHVDRGYFPANAEGYAVSDIDGNVQKIVSRLDFSQANFSKDIVKGWTSEAREKEIINESQIKKFKEDDNQDLNDVLSRNNLRARNLITSKTKTVEVEPVDNITRTAAAENFVKNNDPVIKSEVYYNLNHKSRPLVNIALGDHDLVLQFKDPKGVSKPTTDQQETVYMKVIQDLNHGIDIASPEYEKNLKIENSWLDKYWLDSFKIGAVKINNYLTRDNEDPYYIFSRNSSEENNVHDIINSFYAKNKDELFPKEMTAIYQNGEEIKNISKDKWNPSDIYACRESKKDEIVNNLKNAVNTITSLQEFNAYLGSLLKSRDLIGISLKKVGENSEVEAFNTEEDNTYRNNSYEIVSINTPELLPEGSSRNEVNIVCTDQNGQEYKLQYRTSGSDSFSLHSYKKGSSSSLGRAYGVKYWLEQEIDSSICKELNEIDGSMTIEGILNKLDRGMKATFCPEINSDTWNEQVWEKYKEDSLENFNMNNLRFVTVILPNAIKFLLWIKTYIYKHKESALCKKIINWSVKLGDNNAPFIKIGE